MSETNNATSYLIGIDEATTCKRCGGSDCLSNQRTCVECTICHQIYDQCPHCKNYLPFNAVLENCPHCGEHIGGAQPTEGCEWKNGIEI